MIPPAQNADFVACMEDVLDLYKQPYDPRRPTVNMDELSYQLLGDVRESIPAGPGRPKRIDSEYQRNGTCNLFMFFEPLAGFRTVLVTERRTRIDWARAVKEVMDTRYADAEFVRLVSDNLNTHGPASFYEAFEPAEARRILKRIEFHHTPKHGSRLNMAEIELSVLNGQCLDRRIPDAEILNREVQAWVKERNEANSTVDWRFTTADARIKLKRLYPLIGG